MSIRFLGGIITNNAIQPTTSSAKGIWTLSQQSQAKYSNTWPSPVALDAQFNYVTALLNGDGVNGAQNNTFVDSSTNNFAITRSGNTTQGSFSPYGPNWSNYFNGSSSLSIPTTSALLGAGNFTVEFWVNIPTLPVSGAYFTCCAYGSTGSVLRAFVYDNSGVFFGVWIGATRVINVATPLTAGQWTHIAIVRSGTTLTAYINGVSVGTYGSDSTNYNTGQLYIASQAAANYLTGYISNFRIVVGTAVYTSAFTPSTAPLVAITNTQLLTCQSNQFIDTSSNAFAITANGSPSVQRFNPFGTASAYSTSVIGGSGYFDGSGDDLRLASNVAFGLSTGDFTFEAWINPLNWTNSTCPFYVSAGTGGLWIGKNGTNFVVRAYGVADQLIYATLPTINAWTHIVAVRSGTTLSLFYNGIRVATTSNGYNFTTQAVSIGSDADPGTPAYYTGYISNLRLVKGTAVYNPTLTTLTIPTTPLTAVAGTSLLLLTTNAGIYDSAMMNDYETIDNAQLSTAVKKFGTASIYFDGYLDVLSSPSQPIYNFGTGNFTIEMWVNRAGAGTGDRFLVSRSNGADFLFRWTAGGVLQFHIASTVIAAYTWAFTTGTWYHLAAVRNGSTVTIYIDGTSVATGTNSTNMSSTAPLLIGGYPPTSSDYFNGYIDDLRITNGVARYTANFTPPTAAFPTAGP